MYSGLSTLSTFFEKKNRMMVKLNKFTPGKLNMATSNIFRFFYFTPDVNILIFKYYILIYFYCISILKMTALKLSEFKISYDI